MTTLTESRRPRPTPPLPVCEDCSRPITEPDNTNRLRDAKGHFNGRARHHVCPPVAVHVRVPQPWTLPVLDPIPTRPVQKHFSEASWGRREGGAPWKTVAWIVLAALVAGTLAALVVFMTGVA